MTLLEKIRIKREIALFFSGNSYIWIYYLLAVLANKEHPMEIYVQLMIIGSFLGLPILMFIIIPIVNGLIVGKIYNVKMTLRIVAYIILSMFVLHGLFNVHMAISNHLVKNKLFPEGVEVAAMKHFDELQESTKGEINLLSYEYDAPYHSSINAGNMSGTSTPSIDITYEFVACSSEDCEQTHFVDYDLDTGKLVQPIEPKVGISHPSTNIEWAEEFVGEYIGAEDGLRYTVFMIEHGIDGYKLNFRRYEPYLNIDVLIQQTEPSYVKGKIKDAISNNAKGDYEADSSLAGKTVEFIKEGNQVEIRVDEVSHTTLLPSKKY